MAKLVRQLRGEFREIRASVSNAVMNGSVSASKEDEWYTEGENSRCCVMVFERYSHMGGNRVSMNVTLYQEGDGPVSLCAITSGGSQAMFFKINTIGEETFLDTLKNAL